MINGSTPFISNTEMDPGLLLKAISSFVVIVSSLRFTYRIYLQVNKENIKKGYIKMKKEANFASVDRDDVAVDKLEKMNVDGIDYVYYPFFVIEELPVKPHLEWIWVPYFWATNSRVMILAGALSGQETQPGVVYIHFISFLALYYFGFDGFSDPFLVKLFLTWGRGVFGIHAKKVMIGWAHRYLLTNYSKDYFPPDKEMISPKFEEDKFGWLAFQIIEKYERYFDEL